MDRKKEIIECISGISGKYSSYEVFTDWVRCSALSISNSMDMFHGRIWREREDTYMETMKKYSKEEQKKIASMFGMLVETFDNEMSDVLGEIYMKGEMGSKAGGQFFTPYHISRMCADIAIPKPDKNGKYLIKEPSCGSGGMIIAVASALKEKGIDYQRKMDVVAQDLDWKVVYMCYIQLSLLGINAVVVQGNTLCEPYIKGYQPGRVLYTPARMGVVL